MASNISQPFKILVVDDEPDLEPLMLQRMRRNIRSGQYLFVFANNGVEALDILGKDPTIDMVLSDINMPQMDGLTLLEQIPGVSPDIRCVIVSAYGDMKNIRVAMNRGAFDFVTKPIDFEDLKVTIDRTMKHLEEWREALSSRDKLVSLQNELDVARKMQQSILPTQFPKSPDYQIAARMQAARNVGGDFYDVMNLDERRIGLAIADVSDKGVPAALFMMSCRTLLKGAAIGHGEPGAVLNEVNDLLQESNDAAMFVTTFYAVYNAHNGKLTYANGGHNTPVIIHADGTSTMLPLTDGIALAVVPGYEYGQDTVTIAPGDTVIFYTDGVTEAMNEHDEEFGLERLCQLFEGAPPTDTEKANLAIFQAVNEFAGDAPQSDDITCLVFRRSES